MKKQQEQIDFHTLRTIRAAILRFFDPAAAGYAPAVIVSGSQDTQKQVVEMTQSWVEKAGFQLIQATDEVSMFALLKSFSTALSPAPDALVMTSRTDTLLPDTARFASLVHAYVDRFIQKVVERNQGGPTILLIPELSQRSEAERYLIKDLFWQLACQPQDRNLMICATIDSDDRRVRDLLCQDLHLLPDVCRPIFFEVGDSLDPSNPVSESVVQSTPIQDCAAMLHTALHDEREGEIPKAIASLCHLADYLARDEELLTPSLKTRPTVFLVLARKLVGYGKSERAEKLLRRLFDRRSSRFSPAVKSPRLQLAALLLFADLLQTRGATQEALALLEDADRLLRDRLHARQHGDLQIRRALALLHIGAYERAGTILQELMQAATTPSRSTVAVSLLYGHCLRMTGNPDDAEKKYRQAAAFARSIGYLSGAAVAYQSVAILAEICHNHAVAATGFERALQTFQEAGNAVGEAATRLSRARIFVAVGQMAEAKREMNRCIAFFLKTRNVRDLANVLLDYGVLLRFLGKTSAAMTKFRHGLTVAERSGYRDLVAAARWHLFVGELSTGHWVDARYHLSEAKRIYQQVGTLQQQKRIEVAQQALDGRQFNDSRGFEAALDLFGRYFGQTTTREVNHDRWSAYAVLLRALPTTFLAKLQVETNFWSKAGNLVQRLTATRTALCEQQRQNKSTKQRTRRSWEQLVEQCCSGLAKEDAGCFREHWQNTVEQSDQSEVEASIEETVDKMAVETPVTHTKPYIRFPSSIMQKLENLVRRYAVVDLPVLIEGETGSGKDVIANQIYEHGNRAAVPLVTLDGGMTSDELFEARCFGYVRGAFTGAVKEQEGLFQMANHGTLLIDNIDFISLRNQAKLLRVLQEHEVRRVGSLRAEPVDVRIIAITSKPLVEVLAQGRLREDLLYRLDALRIVAPPLRERQQDIKVLAEYFWQEAAAHFGQAAKLHEAPCNWIITQEAMAALEHYSWPGNVREFRNEIFNLFNSRRLNPMARPIDLQDLTPKILEDPRGALQTTAGLKTEHNLNAVMDTVERQMIIQALQRSDGNVALAARELGIHRSSLRKKIDRLNITEISGHTTEPD